MFGAIGKRKLREKKYKASLKQKEADKLDAEKKKEAEPAEKLASQEAANRKANEMKEQQRLDREQGYADVEKLLSETTGFTPQQRAQKQSVAQQRLNNDIQGHQRRITSEQGARGIRGGAAYAQNADLAQLGLQSQNQYQADLNQLDQDLIFKKVAAKYAGGQGLATQNQLNQQIANDAEETERERKRQQQLDDAVNKILSRI